jgi:CO/xanthine dehydrogenase Mo-binding subunit/aerobic-type carbon monoxide dehydrogenase small subunit (CoxS/CutS family)
MNELASDADLAPFGAREIAFDVNGSQHRVTVEPATRLAEVLRDALGLTGTKVGCDAGDCGACTVLLDGRQVCACLTAAAQAEGRAVTTVEGLARSGVLDRLQRAFLAHAAAQCGICTPGMLIVASDLLARNPRPSEPEVRDALGGVLCRCTGYRKIIEAVLAAADGDVELPEAPAGGAVGFRAPKADGVAKVTGAEAFGADRAPDAALWLRTIRSPHAKARFTLGDFGPLRAKYPGIADVITARDVPLNRFGIFPDVKDQPVLAEGRVRFRGEAVLCLVGERRELLRIREDEIPVQWTPEAPQAELDDALANCADPIHASSPDNVLVRGRVAKGDVEAAIAGAAFVVAGEFTTSFVEHAYIEPEAGYAERIGDRLRIFASTQTPYMDREELARILRIQDTQVHIVPSAVGGGFGGKLDIAVQPLLAVAAWKLKRPVRTVYTRPESMASTTKRHPARMRARLACDRDGRLLAADFSGDFNTGAYASWGTTVANRVPIHASGPYLVPNVRALTRAVYTNAPVAGAFRGFGVPQSTIVHEALLDELADRAGIDKLEIRHRNALRAGQSTATGQVLRASAGLAQCLDALRPRWKEAQSSAVAFNARTGAAGRLKGARRGAGIACMWYGIGNTVIANPSTMRVGLKPEGRIMFYNGAVDIGQGSNTILAQVLADALGLPMGAIDYVMGDTDLTADAGKTSASRQAFVSGNAARLAGERLRERMVALAEARPDARLRLERGTLVAADVEGEKRVDLAELPRDRNGDVLAAEGSFNPPTVPLDREGQGVPYATYAFGAQIAEVEVDLELGTTQLLKITAAHDVGRAINPTQVEGQIHGGIAQGIGLALMEEYHAGRTENLHDYLIPTCGDVPPIEVILVEDPEPLGPYGAKGVGEPALIATAPAIFNAIAHATGVRVRHAPATPDRLRAALLEAFG